MVSPYLRPCCICHLYHDRQIHAYRFSLQGYDTAGTAPADAFEAHLHFVFRADTPGPWYLSADHAANVAANRPIRRLGSFDIFERHANLGILCRNLSTPALFELKLLRHLCVARRYRLASDRRPRSASRSSKKQLTHCAILCYSCNGRTVCLICNDLNQASQS